VVYRRALLQARTAREALQVYVERAPAMTRAITVLVLGIALAVTVAGPAGAQSDEATSGRLEALFGEHEPYQAFLAALKDAVSARDKAAVAAMIAYPFETTIAGERVTLASEDEVALRYDRLFTPAVLSAIDRQTYATLFANAEGVMIGDGHVWFSGICSDAACAKVIVKIIAVNPPATREGLPAYRSTPRRASARSHLLSTSSSNSSASSGAIVNQEPWAISFSN
jgi:hypothetical protein